MTPRDPNGWPGAPDLVANAMLFLASNDALYVTDVELLVDGAGNA